MSDRAGFHEWPLVVFTLAIQLACGLSIAATVLDFSGAAYASEMRPIGIAVFPLIAVGLLSSTLHLGRPLCAWKSILNLGRSRLSLEILFAGLFALAGLAYSWHWFTGVTELRPVLGVVTSVVGLAAVLATAFTYMLPTLPASNSCWLPTAFVGTAALLGGAASAAYVFWNGTEPLATRISLGLLMAGGLIVLAGAIACLIHLYRSQLGGDSVRRSIWSGVYIFLVLLTLLMVTVISHSDPLPADRHEWVGSVLLLVALAAAVIGRRLTYMMVTASAGAGCDRGLIEQK